MRSYHDAHPAYWLALCAALCLVSCALAACGGGQETETVKSRPAVPQCLVNGAWVVCSQAIPVDPSACAPGQVNCH